MFDCFKKPEGKESFDIPLIDAVKNDFTDFEMEVLELVNDHRRSKCLRMCKMDLQLSSIAFEHTEYMVMNGKASHDNFPIRNIQAIENLYVSWLGECVAYGFGTAEGFLNGWLKSEGHRKIIESEKALSFGLSIESDEKNRNYATLLFTD